MFNSISPVLFYVRTSQQNCQHLLKTGLHVVGKRSWKNCGVGKIYVRKFVMKFEKIILESQRRSWKDQLKLESDVSKLSDTNVNNNFPITIFRSTFSQTFQWPGSLQLKQKLSNFIFSNYSFQLHNNVSLSAVE